MTREHIRVKDALGHKSLPTVKHLTPCKECPFRRCAPAGWLGGGTAAEWHGNLIFGDTAFVCHMAEAAGKRHFCAGSMIHYRNSMKSPRDPEFAKMVLAFSKDSVAVFEWPHEFQQHHAAGILALDKPSQSARAMRGKRRG